MLRRHSALCDVHAAVSHRASRLSDRMLCTPHRDFTFLSLNFIPPPFFLSSFLPTLPPYLPPSFLFPSSPSSSFLPFSLSTSFLPLSFLPFYHFPFSLSSSLDCCSHHYHSQKFLVSVHNSAPYITTAYKN